MNDPGINKIFAVVCWLGTVLCGFLALYMRNMAASYPGMEAFASFGRAMGVVTVLWLVAALWFTFLGRSRKKKR